MKPDSIIRRKGNYILSKLIVKVNMFVDPKDFDNIVRYINENYDKGTLVLPAYCDFAIVHDDCELEIKKEN